MPFGGRFLKRLVQGLALTGTLAASGAGAQASGFLFGFRDENGMAHLYGTNVSGHDFHCGEHPLVGCVPVYDRQRNFLGYWYYNGQLGYVCHWGRREVSPYTHIGQAKPPEPLYYPCPALFVPYLGREPHFVDVPADYFVPFPHQPQMQEPDIEPGIVYRKTFYAGRSEEGHARLQKGRDYKISITLVGGPWCRRTRIGNICTNNPWFVNFFGNFAYVDCEHPASTRNPDYRCGNLLDDRLSDENIWWIIRADDDSSSISFSTRGSITAYRGIAKAEVYDLGPSRNE